MSSRISGTLQTPPQIFMRIIPRFVGSDIKGSSLDATGYRLFLQRGLQVMGKSLPVQAPKMGKRSEFSNGDKFDFQIINDKNLDYMFALYSIDEVGNEQRIQSVAFNAKSYYNSFIQSGKAQFRQQIRFPHQKIALQIIILINNVIQSLARLTEGLLPKPSPPIQQQPLNEQIKGKIQKSQGKFFNVNSFNIGKVQEMLPDESNGPAIEEQIGEEKARTKKLMFNTPETAFESQEIQNLPKIEGSSKMGKITLIVVALLILVVLIGGGVIPSFNKKGKKKSKNKKSSMF